MKNQRFCWRAERGAGGGSVADVTIYVLQKCYTPCDFGSVGG